jgi:hypothetical protein
MAPADAVSTVGAEPATLALPVVMLPGGRVLATLSAAALAIVVAGRIFGALPTWLLAAEVLATIVGLFVFGSFRVQIHKNVLTYGMLTVIVATFSQLTTSEWHTEIAASGAR